MKKNIVIFLLILSSATAFAQRQGNAPQPLPISTLHTKIVDVHRLYFTVFYNSPIMPEPATQHTFNRPTMMLNDRAADMADLNNHSLADIDRIEYIEPDATQQSAASLVNMLYAFGHKGVIFIYTKQFINSSPASLRSGSPAYMGYPNLVKRAYTKP